MGMGLDTMALVQVAVGSGLAQGIDKEWQRLIGLVGSIADGRDKHS